MCYQSFSSFMNPVAVSTCMSSAGLFFNRSITQAKQTVPGRTYTVRYRTIIPFLEF